MKRYLLSFILLSPALTSFHINTSDIWQIYYNKEKIQEYSETKNDNLIHINARSVKSIDTLTIKYFSTTECPTCTYELIIPTEAGGMNFFEVQSSSKAISLTLKELLAYHKDNNYKPLPILFVINNRGNSEKKLPICSIKFE